MKAMRLLAVCWVFLLAFPEGRLPGQERKEEKVETLGLEIVGRVVAYNLGGVSTTTATQSSESSWMVVHRRLIVRVADANDRAIGAKYVEVRSAESVISVLRNFKGSDGRTLFRYPMADSTKDLPKAMTEGLTLWSFSLMLAEHDPTCTVTSTGPSSFDPLRYVWNLPFDSAGIPVDAKLPCYVLKPGGYKQWKEENAGRYLAKADASYLRLSASLRLVTTQ